MHSIEGGEPERGQVCAKYLLGSERCLFLAGPRIEGESLAIAVVVYGHW